MITLNEGLEDQTVVLESRAVNPFNDWADWYGTDGEAVVTFRTMKEQLWNRWSNDCVSFEHPDCDHGDSLEEMNESINCDEKQRIVEHEKFNPTNLQAPGIYLDRTPYDDEEKVDESYTIIVPYPFLSPKLCREWIQKLNEQYNRDFELEITEDQKKRSRGLEDLGMNRVKVPKEDEKSGSGGSDE